MGLGGKVPGSGSPKVGIMNVITKFIVPIAGFGGGWMVGDTVVSSLASFFTDFIPFFGKVNDMATSRSSSINIAFLIAGGIIIAFGVVIGTLVRGWLGSDGFGAIIAVAAASFTIGMGVRGIVSGFGPLQTAVDAAGAGSG